MALVVVVKLHRLCVVCARIVNLVINVIGFPYTLRAVVSFRAFLKASSRQNKEQELDYGGNRLPRCQCSDVIIVVS